jgi:DNA-binding transcriptional ArsR family regulator
LTWSGSRVIYNQMVVGEIADADVDRLFHALADATRRDIVRTALDTELSVSTLARRYPVSLTAVQKHVAVLEQAGLVTKRRHGREMRVVGQMDAIQRAQHLLDTLEQVWRGRVDRMQELLAQDEQRRDP